MESENAAKKRVLDADSDASRPSLGDLINKMAMRNDVFDAAVKRLKASQSTIDQKEQELYNQHVVHLNFVADAFNAAKAMTNQIENLKDTLEKESYAR